ncbi:1,2-phenylacetyl-CoA epoxidase subunit PaaD [Desmospora profundinema]|uniref:Ring-1,2-phenylacetyl-CoA epoxidase subunit PaaD n=1 Tax=Desmospora profundinema TaxID=1571184 RepID=A0ABU1IPP6_9BACL|nr:1,2-phenylacetyl-CoA epoxidase subunit PaaD [Desmospora profundinema]MDR6226760.1 ring-1,2-phenylacetyl-CoA epoxidase subunit PaaD [Desmospora profundinema]
MMTTTGMKRLWLALENVKDPEIPSVSIVELGMVNAVEEEGGGRVRVSLTPTFVGCPALDLIADSVRGQLTDLEGVEGVEVAYVMDPPWTSDRITPQGRRKLQEFGIAPPPSCLEVAPDCPFCGAGGGEVHNLFGPTACRAIFYCKRCHQPFEGMKPV